MTVNILLKVDGLVGWPWVTVLWPLFIMLSILFISSLTSLFVFMSWLCSWLMGNQYGVGPSDSFRSILGGSDEYGTSSHNRRRRRSRHSRRHHRRNEEE
jgi:hypothetical protein